MSNLEKLDFNSELLKPMKEQLEIIINRLMSVCMNTSKEAEISLKINLDACKKGEYDKGKLVKEWTEPKLEYQISEKIKEVKNTNKGLLGIDYEIKVNKEDMGRVIGKEGRIIRSIREIINAYAMKNHQKVAVDIEEIKKENTTNE